MIVFSTFSFHLKPNFNEKISINNFNLDVTDARRNLSGFANLDTNLFELFPKHRDAQIADAIVELFRKSENIDIFNKKALYIYIKEMTEASTPQITKIIKRLKVIYVKKYNEYYDNGHITMSI